MNKIQINGCFKSAEFISRFNFNFFFFFVTRGVRANLRAP